MNRSINKKIVRFLVLFLLAAVQAFVQERPKVGLVLSGGGAKGFAHVGVLKVIEEVGLQIDYITGTSVGSIVGGLYSIGYDAKDLEELVRNTDWIEVFSDNSGRRALGMEQKLWDARYMISLPFHNRKVHLPSGLVGGQKLQGLFSRLTLPVHNIYDFTKLPIPFACVATDILTGKAVTLQQGFLPEAMRASMAIPTIFTPVKIGNHVLLDGGLVRNFPVEDVRDLGADFVIGVDVSAPLHTEEELGSLVNILDQAISFSGVASTNEQRQLCDLLILPDMEDMSAIDFLKADSLIIRGERAARQMMPQLSMLADSLAHFSVTKHKSLQFKEDSFYIYDITIDGLKRISSSLVHSELGITTPGRTSIEEIEKAVDRVYSSQFFESVIYRIEASKNGDKLRIKVVEKSEDLFRFGLRYNNNTEASVILSTVFRNVAKQSSFLNLDLILGQRIVFDGQYYFHLGLRSGIGLRARLNYSDVLLDIFDESQRQATLDIKSIGSDGLIGSVFSTKIAAGIGFRGDYADISPRVATADSFSFDSKLFSLFSLIWLDTFDRADFPRSGASLVLRNELASTRFGSDANFTRHYADIRGVIPLHRKVSIGGQVVLGTTTGDDLPLHRRFILGGLDNPILLLATRLSNVSFVGLKAQELIGDHIQFFQFNMQYEMFPRMFILFRLNAGNTLDEWKVDFSRDRFETGLGLTFGALTPLGPVELTLMGGSRHSFLTHLNIGYKF